MKIKYYLFTLLMIFSNSFYSYSAIQQMPNINAIDSEGNKEKVIPLYEGDRVNYICRADYSAGSDLEKVMKLIIDSIKISDSLQKKEITLLNKEDE